MIKAIQIIYAKKNNIIKTIEKGILKCFKIIKS